MGCVQSAASDVSQVKNTKKITDPITLGGIRLNNRIVMAPMTRCRGDPTTGVPNDLMKEYYTQRASFGLIITECSQISPLSNAFPGSGGIYSKDQIQGWKKIVDSVHSKGGKIILQIWHSGRAVPSEFIGGAQPIAPSPIPISTNHQYTKQPHPVPKEMTKEDIKKVIEEFRQGAINAKEAGFDGVQLHGANGYLVDQFLKDGTNKRTDEYGGSIENRCRFMLEALDALISVYGAKFVSVRFTPTGRYNDMYDSNPQALMKYALNEVSKKNIGFVEIKRHASYEQGKGDGQKVDEKGRTLPQYQIPDYFKTLRSYYKGILMGNDGFDPVSAQKEIDDGNLDLVSFGSLAITNPDFVERVKNGWELNTKQDYGTYFAGGEKGYTDFQNYRL